MYVFQINITAYLRKAYKKYLSHGWKHQDVDIYGNTNLLKIKKSLQVAL